MDCKGRGNAVRTFAVVLCMFLLAEREEAALVTVGGGKGWGFGVDYKSWAAKTKVQPSDFLFFKYDNRAHNVMQVSRANYNSCTRTNPWLTYRTGKDTVKFSKPGTYYFICGAPGHCQAGMKVAIKVR